MHLLRHPRRLTLPLAAAGALAFPAAAQAACAGQDAAPGTPVAAGATLCLLNAERAAQGLGPLAASPALAGAAGAHAADMVARGYFAHVSPDGGTLEQRLQAAGWMPSAGSWRAGEDIAWGSGALGTPARIVAAWMASPGHRANILQPGFTQVGIGIAAGAPRPGTRAQAGTYVADFGAQDAMARGGGGAAPAAGPAAATTGDLAAVKNAIAAAQRRPAAASRAARHTRGRCAPVARHAKARKSGKARKSARRAAAAKRCRRA